MKILLAGPGTGKTTHIKDIIRSEYSSATRVLVISFTNVTVNDLAGDFSDYPAVRCYTLHSYALRINHLTDRYILDGSTEAPIIENLAEDLGVDLGYICELLGCITFDAMVTECLRFLGSNPTYAAEKIGKLDLLIVDEYQDFNAVERQLIDMIAGYAAECIVLGDDDQSIYGFKDADPDGIISLYNSANAQKIEHDNRCHRCPDAVVASATALIRRNRNRIPKEWIPTGKSGEIAFRQFLTPNDTNRFIISEIASLRTKMKAPSILVLSPVGFYVRELIDLFQEAEMDFVDFWENTVPEDTCAKVWWIRAIFTPRALLNMVLLSSIATQYHKRLFKTAFTEAIKKNFDAKAFIESTKGSFDANLFRHVGQSISLEDFLREHPDFSTMLADINPNDVAGAADCIIRSKRARLPF